MVDRLDFFCALANQTQTHEDAAHQNHCCRLRNTAAPAVEGSTTANPSSVAFRFRITGAPFCIATVSSVFASKKDMISVTFCTINQFCSHLVFSFLSNVTKHIHRGDQ